MSSEKIRFLLLETLFKVSSTGCTAEEVWRGRVGHAVVPPDLGRRLALAVGHLRASLVWFRINK